MSEQPRSDQDMAFARVLAEKYRGQFFDDDQAPRFGVSANHDASILLSSLELQVSRYIDSPPSFLPAYLRRLFEHEIARARRLFTVGHDVLVLRKAGNGFGLDVIVDVFNRRARRALSRWGQRDLDYRDDGPAVPPLPGPPLTREWIDDVARGPAPVRFASGKEGSTSFLTLFSDALRISATTASSAQPLQVYTANCNLKGWILEIWPQFNYSPMRFGTMMTWPVTDTLPTTGNYMFQGLKGASVQQDPTPHYLGPSRTQTLVKL
jgi:hypothetical protein